MLPLVLNTGEVVPAPKMGEPVDPRYPLVRQLYVVLKWKQGEPMPPMAEELLRYVLSRSGQEDAVKAGLLPLRRDEVLASRDQLGWTGATNDAGCIALRYSAGREDPAPGNHAHRETSGRATRFVASLTTLASQEPHR